MFLGSKLYVYVKLSHLPCIFSFSPLFLLTFRAKKCLMIYWTWALSEYFFSTCSCKKINNSQQNHNSKTTKLSSSAEVVPSYNRTHTLSSSDLFALQWGCGWNHLNADNFSMSSYSPCLLLDKDKLAHSSLRQNHKIVIYSVICIVLSKVLFIQNPTENRVFEWGFEACPLSLG